MACEPKALVSAASCFMCLSVLQLQAIKTLKICQYPVGPVLPTPVLSADFTQNINWIGTLGTGQTKWNVYQSQTAVGGFTLFDQVPAAQNTFAFDQAYTGFFWYVVGINVSNAEVTNHSNTVQAPPLALDEGDFDSPQIGWVYGNPTLPNFWSIYHYNGSGDINNPANYTFLNSVAGTEVGQADGLNHGDDYFVRGTANADGSSPQTVYSNHVHTFP